LEGKGKRGRKEKEKRRGGAGDAATTASADDRFPRNVANFFCKEKKKKERGEEEVETALMGLRRDDLPAFRKLRS